MAKRNAYNELQLALCRRIENMNLDYGDIYNSELLDVIDMIYSNFSLSFSDIKFEILTDNDDCSMLYVIWRVSIANYTYNIVVGNYDLGDLLDNDFIDAKSMAKFFVDMKKQADNIQNEFDIICAVKPYVAFD